MHIIGAQVCHQCCQVRSILINSSTTSSRIITNSISSGNNSSSNSSNSNNSIGSISSWGVHSRHR